MEEKKILNENEELAAANGGAKSPNVAGVIGTAVAVGAIIGNFVNSEESVDFAKGQTGQQLLLGKESEAAGLDTKLFVR